MICRACNQTKPETEFTKCGQGRRSICAGCDNAARRQRDFGISGEEFELLRRVNNGLCWCCGKRPASVVDHDHGHSDSRTALLELQPGLGLLGDDLEGVLRAVEYLRRYEARKATTRKPPTELSEWSESQ